MPPRRAVPRPVTDLVASDVEAHAPSPLLCHSLTTSGCAGGSGSRSVLPIVQAAAQRLQLSPVLAP